MLKIYHKIFLVLFIIRLKKLLSTLTIVKQLDKNMAELRQWLLQTEHKLSTPVVFQTIDNREIQTYIKNHQVRLMLIFDYVVIKYHNVLF